MFKELSSILINPRRASAFAGALLGLTSLTAVPSVQAAVPAISPDTVVAGDTYSIRLFAFNTINPTVDNYQVTDPSIVPVFGTSQPYPGGADGGQTLTVTSSESFNNGVFTATISISVPTNFVPSSASPFADGRVVNALDFSIGLVASTGGTDTLDFTQPITLLSVTGSAVYSMGSVGLTQNAVLTNGNMSFSNEEAVQSVNETTSISLSNVTSLSVTITYAVPEPSTYGAVLLGVAGLGWLTVVRRRRARG